MPSRFCSPSSRRRPARSCRQRGRTCGRGEPPLSEHPADGGEVHVCRQSWIRSPGNPASSRMPRQKAYSRQELSSSGNTRSARSARGSGAISFAASDPNQMVHGPVLDRTVPAAVLARGGLKSGHGDLLSLQGTGGGRSPLRGVLHAFSRSTASPPPSASGAGARARPRSASSSRRHAHHRHAQASWLTPDIFPPVRLARSARPWNPDHVLENLVATQPELIASLSASRPRGLAPRCRTSARPSRY